MSPAKPRTRTSAAEVRSALLTAGRTILERDGESGLTVRAVAAEAKVAPMGVYNHFDGRDGLLDALVTDAFVEFGRAVAATDDDPVARLRNSGRAYREFAMSNPVIYGLMFSAHCTPEPEAAINAFAVLVDVIRYGQVAGVIMAGDPSDLAVQAWSAVHGAVSLELAGTHPPQVDAPQSYEKVLDFVARGFAPPPRA
ncbi:TetR/AcrR family transcriptional regulator [Gordonia sp. zg691]|uniref:TetR/AcrR family transcriptional regulator n=1 Tax=Gordonia jinghuaiqii TaxID=2758710 RepID=A0A7D7LXJ3_9ACTN|nr:TetR/AcrR family transcriptional regulator [Gordonia jinghuaiqii]MBD0860401.1 TetR/AcrR family transcriptional regulator [Gordonia jinghuaiqii]MCR5978329.1 TetR family transcriptional regulator [Gordonia jinghuaiqii]QMT01236.1 TetR/AcrR family transcriptional regulator [Gordonia jinghuaiqii]